MLSISLDDKMEIATGRGALSTDTTDLSSVITDGFLVGN